MLKLKSALIAIGLMLAPALPALAQSAAPIAAPVTTAPAPVTASPAAANDNKAAKPAETTIGTSRPDPSIGQPIDGRFGLQPQVTKLGRQAAWLHDYPLMVIMVGISVFVLGLLFYVMFRFRRKANPVASKTSHNLTIEVIWTLVPALILAAIAIPSISLLAQQFKPAPAGAVTLKAIGNQWFWVHEYPDHGIDVTSNILSDDEAAKRGEPRLLGVDNRVVLPVNTPIRLLTTANDVIHAWAIPAFWIKMDAVPGRINETSFTVEKEGVYYGQCSELCGIKHAYMPIAVEVVSKAKFEEWVRAKGGKMPTDAVAAEAAAPAAANAAAPASANTAAPAATKG